MARNLRRRSADRLRTAAFVRVARVRALRRLQAPGCWRVMAWRGVIDTQSKRAGALAAFALRRELGQAGRARHSLSAARQQARRVNHVGRDREVGHGWSRIVHSPNTRHARPVISAPTSKAGIANDAHAL